MTKDALYMQRCLELATLGMGKVAPNPMVGCVIVYEDQIIGEGYHQKYGAAHAEVNAINAVKDKSLLEKSTLYVSLEPCAHYGKTPPCADLIIHHKIPKVVIACIDSFSLVAGKGVEKLKNTGVEVKVGILEKEALFLNRRFFTVHQKNRPYIILKWAQSEDGFMDIDRSAMQKGIFWISKESTQILTHRWRSEEDAILVGKNTVEIDNPSLTVRAVKGKNPIRVVIDKNLSLAPEHKVFNEDAATLHINQKYDSKVKQYEQIAFDFEKENALIRLMGLLKERSISSVIIEGGKHTLEAFIKENLWDEARIITGNKKIHQGLPAPILAGTSEENYTCEEDQIKILYK
jgi:diaminohydroxyphosphoribosylaminopyrimidine deaminase/5-amino-6-(5-phosphoribosylamino)uracil reductase